MAKDTRNRQKPSLARKAGGASRGPAGVRPRPAAKPKTAPEGKRVTLSRALSKLGFCSRTQAETLIAEGRVALSGRTVTDPETWIDLTEALITVDSKRVVAEARLYLMLNKPRGLVTTRHDPEGRPTVFDCLVDHADAHLSPVGRLDKASEGLLLFTNDTQFANALLDPATHVAKTYHVQLDRIADDAVLAALEAGVHHDGEFLRAKAVRRLREGEKNSWLEITLDEGRNRQIRRMLEALGIECLRLLRISIGNLELGTLEKGAMRALTEAEMKDLRRLIRRS
ncbi:rRNA pseudouridine synthase [Shinella sp. CPCC 101442]|uniref:pseudouridine synthase n=1 Tax=Shinella sp. CPCC 101442 TaxID=2932265 RepID=UPI00215374B9|nr:pseudouridine synthase [Shinella sp. CPCC 101442]MCR6499505.1 rRNA pseudouridine synthase [Shinella sp. CPCC 101442]